VNADSISPHSSERIELAELNGLLVASAPSATIWMADNWKYLCKWDDVALFLAQDETNKAEYIAEEHDCDDFSFRLKGQFSVPAWSALALGICWTTTHALNCFVCEDRRLWFIEPQTDAITETLDEEICVLII
jgi:hypothetical protein